MQIFLSRRRASASGKRAIFALTLVMFSSLYVAFWSIKSLVLMVPRRAHPKPKICATLQGHAHGGTSVPSPQGSVRQMSCHPRKRSDHTQTLPPAGGRDNCAIHHSPPEDPDHTLTVCIGNRCLKVGGPVLNPFKKTKNALHADGIQHICSIRAGEPVQCRDKEPGIIDNKRTLKNIPGIPCLLLCNDPPTSLSRNSGISRKVCATSATPAKKAATSFALFSLLVTTVIVINISHAGEFHPLV